MSRDKPKPADDVVTIRVTQRFRIVRGQLIRAEDLKFETIWPEVKA